MTKLTDDDRKELTKYLGLCWHEIVEKVSCLGEDEVGKKYTFNEYKCLCGKPYSDNQFYWLHQNRTFSTPADLHAVFGKMVEKREWEEFESYCWLEWLHIMRPEQFSAWLFCLACPDQIPERMKMVCEWLRGEIMNLVVPIEKDGVDRGYQKCRCRKCGTVETCTPRFDFYTIDEYKDGYLYCENCFRGYLNNNLKSKGVASDPKP